MSWPASTGCTARDPRVEARGANPAPIVFLEADGDQGTKATDGRGDALAVVASSQS
jgi:hypothetical protein